MKKSVLIALCFTISIIGKTQIKTEQYHDGVETSSKTNLNTSMEVFTLGKTLYIKTLYKSEFNNYTSTQTYSIDGVNEDNGSVIFIAKDEYQFPVRIWVIRSGAKITLEVMETDIKISTIYKGAITFSRNDDYENN